MADVSMADAPIAPDVALEFSECAIDWLQKNAEKLETLVAGDTKVYNLEEWETFERWANCVSNKLDEANAHIKKLQAERAQMQEKIARLDIDARRLSRVSPKFRTSMGAIEKLVCNETGFTWQPARHDERISDRLDILVRCMAEKVRSDETPELSSSTRISHGDRDPRGLIATRGAYELLYSR